MARPAVFALGVLLALAAPVAMQAIKEFKFREPVSRVCLGVPLTVAIKPTTNADAKLTISDNLAGVLKADLVDGTLSIYHVKEATIDMPLQVTLELPTTTKDFSLELSGVAGAILGPGFAFSKFAARLSGATRLSAANKRAFSAKAVALSLAGTSEAVLEGELGSVDLLASGTTKVWLIGVAGDVSLEMSGTCQSYIDPASDKVKITGRVTGVVTNSYTQGQCSVVAGNPVTTRPCNKVARLPSPPAPPRWTCGVIFMQPTNPGCSWTSGNRRRLLTQTVIVSGPGSSSITTSNSRSTIVSSGGRGSTTAVASERVACSVGADQLVVQLK